MSLTKATYSMINGAVANVLDYGADITGVTDSTSAIQAAIDTGKDVYLPTGAYLVDPDVGLVVKNGTTIFGEGRANSIIVAKPNGGTIAELAAYTKGSVIKRNFSLSTTNPYVSYVSLRDFAVVLNHPAASVTSTEMQIGIDLRNITRSSVERVWVGNDAPTDQTIYVKAAPTSGYGVQGWGIALGTIAGGTSYAGGEVNTINDCNVVGAYKGIVLDDGNLSPLSSTHASSVRRCDVQGCQTALACESRYTANIIFEDNTLQNATLQPGNANPTYILRTEGYNGYINSGYIEGGSNTDYILYLGAESKTNNVNLSYYGSTGGTGYISDAGSKNTIRFFESTATSPAVDSLGAPIYLYDNNYKLPYKSLWVKFHWNGSAIVIDGSSGNVSVTRTGAGDYLMTYAQTYPSDDYAISVALDTNASGHGGTFCINSHSNGNARLLTYAQNGATTTQIDPRYVWFNIMG